MFQFIKREKIYILILLFILAINVMHPAPKKTEPPPQKKPLSSMTFQEAGITEERVKDFFESGKISARFFGYMIILGFFIFIIALILNISFIFKRETITLKDLPQRKPVSWGILDLIRVSLIIIFIGYMIGIVESFILKIFHINIGLNLRMILSTFFIDIIAGIVILYFVVVRYKEKLEALGLRFRLFFKNILQGITAYIFILPLLFVVLILSIWFLNLLGYSPPPQPVFEAFMEEKRSRMLFFLTIFVSILGPVIEEIFFRGFMYSAIKKRLGILGAMFLSASIFSLLHTNIVGFLPIMTLGVLLAYLYETTGSLIASMAVHIIHNSIIIGFVFFIKELLA